MAQLIARGLAGLSIGLALCSPAATFGQCAASDSCETVPAGTGACDDGCLGPASPYAGSLCERAFLLGDPGGLRSGLADDGVTVNVSSTQFYQGVASGGIDQQFEFSGRADYLINVNGEKAGLWKGSFLFLHGETRYGDTVNGITGALMPVNTGGLFPVTDGTQTALTGIKFMQALSETFIVFGGKINTLDELTQPYAGGRGVDAFMNLQFALPVTAARTVPYSTWGGGFAVLQGLEPVLSLMVLDTHNTPTTTGFDEFFTNGVSIVAKANVPTKLFDLPGHQGVWGTYSTGKYNDLEPTAYFDPEVGPVVVFGKDRGSWAIFYSADQALYVDPSNPKRSWGLFTNIGLADNGPSPVRWSANVGVGGSSLLRSRPLDTFGIGYAYTGYSDPVKNLAPVLLPVQDDQVVELFYNIAVTPWFHLTPDLQVVVPARERTLPPAARDIDTALVVGVRAKVDF
jgi:porin